MPKETALTDPAAIWEGFDEIQITPEGIDFTDGRALYAFAKMAVRSGLVPKAIDSAQKVCMIVLAGRELGVGPMQALQSISAINGHTAPYGDLVTHRIDISPVIKDREEWWEVGGDPVVRMPIIQGKDDDVCAVCKLTYQRPGMDKPATQEYAYHLGHAIRAGLFPGREDSSWFKYPGEMLMRRARSRCGQMVDGNVFKGFPVEIEIRNAWDRARTADVDQVVEASINVDDVKPMDPDTPDPGAERQQDETAAFKWFRTEKGEDDPKFKLETKDEIAARHAQPQQDPGPAEPVAEQGSDEASEPEAHPDPESGELPGIEPGDPSGGRIEILIKTNNVKELKVRIGALTSEAKLDVKALTKIIYSRYPKESLGSLTKDQLAWLVWFLESGEFGAVL